MPNIFILMERGKVSGSGKNGNNVPANFWMTIKANDEHACQKREN